MTSLYYNPAGIALGTGTRVYVEGTFAYRTVDYDRDPGTIDNPMTGTPEDAYAANSGEAHLANTIASPFAGITTDALGPVTLGLAFYVPFGGQAKWDKNEAYDGSTAYPGAVDGTQRWAVIEGEQRTMYFTLGAAWATPDKKVALGLGLNAIRNDVSLVRARNATGTDDVVSEGRSLLEADNLVFGIGIGATYTPTDKVRLGVSYQSKPGFGEVALEGTLTNRFGAGENANPVKLLQTMPDIVRIGAEVKVDPKATIRLGADWQRWSAYDDQCLIPSNDPKSTCTFNEDGSIDEAGGGSTGVIVNFRRDWKDTFGLKAGVGYALSDKLELAGSLSYDTNAVPDETMDPSLFDMNKWIAQVGGDFAINDMFAINATIAHVFYSSRTTDPRSRDPQPPSRNPDMAGSYSQAVTYALLGVGVKI